MITARNYAAQAERGLIKASDELLRRGFDLDAANFRALSKKIGDSVHFAIEDGGRIFADGLRGLLDTRIRLPYPKITVECYTQNNAVVPPELVKIAATPNKIVIFAEEKKINEDNYSIDIVVVHYLALPDLWSCGPYSLHLPDNYFSNKPGESYIEYRANTPQMTEDDFAVGRLNNSHIPTLKNGLFTAAACLFEFLEALSCKNVHSETLEYVSEAKNVKRIKDGKLPLYETKILVVDTTHAAGGKHSVATNDDHASVRQHLRRGHIRRHPTAGNIWVNSCVVGHAELGVIEKQYQVK